MSDPVFQQFKARWERVTDLPPQRMGIFTPFYKMIVSRLKVMPWPLMLAVSIVSVGILALLLGRSVIILVSVLQRGI